MAKINKLLANERKITLSADTLDAILKALTHLACAARRLAARQVEPATIDLTCCVDGIVKQVQAEFDL